MLKVSKTIFQPIQIYPKLWESSLDHKSNNLFKRLMKTIVELAYYKSNPKNRDYMYRLIHQSGIKVDKKSKAVLLLYPDAIGQGFEEVESQVMSKYPEVYVLNGRRRLFLLDNTTRIKLRLRRWVEKYFILELIVFITWPILLFLAIVTRWPNSKKVSNRHKHKKQAVENYWNKNPQTYGLTHGQTVYRTVGGEKKKFTPGTKQFFRRVDEEFYKWNKQLCRDDQGRFIPFVKIFDYGRYKGKQVLEIGCGMGTMAANWAEKGANITAVDLNKSAVSQTQIRFKLFGYTGNIRTADARDLPFANNQFDYIYSWGVLHHSPDITKSMAEVYRTLKPGGRVGFMLYSKNSLLYQYTIAFLEGWLHLESEFLNELELSSRYTDGYREEGNPYTRPVTKTEVEQELMRDFVNVKISTIGSDMPVLLNQLCPIYGQYIPKSITNLLGKQWGWSLWVEGEKA